MRVIKNRLAGKRIRRDLVLERRMLLAEGLRRVPKIVHQNMPVAFGLSGSVQGLGFRVQDLECRISSSRFRG